jgi:transglutaminase-like putative cysteine protease
MLLCIEHETKLIYSDPVAEHVFELRKAPLSDEDQTTLGYRLRVAPTAPVTPYRDGYGNRVDLLTINQPCQEVLVRATSYVRTQRRVGEARLDGVAWPRREAIDVNALEYLQNSPLVGNSPELQRFLAELPPADDSVAAGVRRLLDAVRGRLTYEKKVTSARTPVGEALILGRGVCQDFAHLFLAGCRGQGLPARYVSGYIHQPGEIATHAWAQVWGGSLVGWVDVDPTHDRFATDDYVVTAVGRDFSDVPPNRGVWKGRAEETITVLVTVKAVTRLPGDWMELDPLPPRAASGTPGLRPSRSGGLSHQTGARDKQAGQQQQ